MTDNKNEQPAEDTQPRDDPVKEKMAILCRLAATIAHDIRNPLGTINTSVFSIKTAIEKNQPERIERALMLAERNIKRCDQILAEFINITRKVEIKTGPVKVDTLIKNILEEHTIPQSIECINDLNCDYAVNLDPEQLKRAVSNIITNAIQAMKDNNKAGQLIIHTSMSGDRLVINVSDTGTGISDDVYLRIYEPLFSTKRFGVGLGLTVAREIVEKHKGTIVIETKVTLKIPTTP